MESLICRIQEVLLSSNIQAWLFYDFQGLDPIGRRILKLPRNSHETRRWFYLVPAKGIPVKLTHKIEPNTLDHLPGDKVLYAGWRELESGLSHILTEIKQVAMQYSPLNAIPYVSKVDAGTIELVRKTGTNIVSSCDLIQYFEAVWTKEQFQSHIKAANLLRKIVDITFAEIGKRTRMSHCSNEFEIQQFMMELFKKEKLITNYPPIVAVNANSGNPHYTPNVNQSSPIKEGDFVLLDLWAKCKEPADAVYADITWTGFIGKEVPKQYIDIFEIVTGARDAAIAFIKDKASSGNVLFGWEIDDVTRNFITRHGYSHYFTHRTGHSIGEEVHWNGANIDNFETRDERQILPNTCFSIEPGIYLPEFGIRSEVNVYVDKGSIIITGEPIQHHIVSC